MHSVMEYSSAELYLDSSVEWMEDFALACPEVGRYSMHICIVVPLATWLITVIVSQ